jgi:serine/threonine protein kinase
MPLLAESQRVRQLERILAAFVQIHEADVLHRDICPKNILMFGDTPKVSDFGLSVDRARGEVLTRSSLVAGKDAYMAPEAKDGLKHSTIASEVYSLGKLMQFVLTTCQSPSMVRCPSLAPARGRSARH